MMKNIAVFASGQGTNFAALIHAVETGDLPCQLVLLVCDRNSAKAIERAERAMIPTFVFDAKQHQGKADYELAILKKLREYKVDFIVLAGYMRLIGETILQAFDQRIVNIHPSLLPAFPGKDAIGQALQAGATETGVTIHYVDAGMDTGAIIAQEKVPIEDGDDAVRLQAKIQQTEHKLYPHTLAWLLNGGKIK